MSIFLMFFSMFQGVPSSRTLFMNPIPKFDSKSSNSNSGNIGYNNKWTKPILTDFKQILEDLVNIKTVLYVIRSCYNYLVCKYVVCIPCISTEYPNVKTRNIIIHSVSIVTLHYVHVHKIYLRTMNLTFFALFQSSYVTVCGSSQFKINHNILVVFAYT